MKNTEHITVSTMSTQGLTKNSTHSAEHELDDTHPHQSQYIAQTKRTCTTQPDIIWAAKG